MGAAFWQAWKVVLQGDDLGGFRIGVGHRRDARGRDDAVLQHVGERSAGVPDGLDLLVSIPINVLEVRFSDVVLVGHRVVRSLARLKELAERRLQGGI
ncbi:hypothetical protein [Mycolicibacterium mageritense]|uniref:hypothetical protein n=1 Tax=Mycolicibacterium mageritense TaxID=53462 RepID=UPI0011DAF3E6|nr:hypothetical protein [Mycolicibacterium mageritense]TXI55760.1 MAG: hypothetical protein E6Q55_30590 [Mycolicibacterium mageritense]